MKILLADQLMINVPAIGDLFGAGKLKTIVSSRPAVGGLLTVTTYHPPETEGKRSLFVAFMEYVHCSSVDIANLTDKFA